MLPYLIFREKKIESGKKSIVNFVGGVGLATFNPSKLPNLSVWYKNDMFFNPPTNNLFRFNDFLNPGNGVQGALLRSVPTRDLTTLNGFTVLNYTTNTAVDYVTQILNPYNQLFLTGSRTYGLIVRQDSSTAGRSCISARESSGAGAFSNFSFTQGTVLNKFTCFVRTQNSQNVIVNSITDFNGAGWQIVVVTFDFATKTLIMYENGNTISANNVLMDTFVWNAVSRIFGYQCTGSAPPGGWWIGGLGEFFIYSDVKSTVDVNQLGNYLATKYILTWINV